MFDEARWIRATVTGRRVWHDGLWTLRLDQQPVFEPGQFAMLALPGEDREVKRAYSISSAPCTDVEFFVVRVDDGALTPRLWALQEGDPVWMTRRLSGLFTLKKMDDGGVLWMVGTGTGLGPYVSMLRHGEAFARFDHVVLVHGVRFGDDLAYADELRALEADHPFTYVPSVTREDVPDVLRGRIPDLLADGRLEAAAGRALRPEHDHVMLCGNPAMVMTLLGALKERGMGLWTPRRPGRVHMEKYW